MEGTTQRGELPRVRVILGWFLESIATVLVTLRVSPLANENAKILSIEVCMARWSLWEKILMSSA